MNTHIKCAVVAANIVCAALAVTTCAANSIRDEITTARTWSKSHLQVRATSQVPFSFVFDGKPSSELLPTWNFEKSSKALDKLRRQTTVVWTDHKTHMQVRCVSVEYADYPTVEWTVYFKVDDRSQSAKVQRKAAAGADGRMQFSSVP